MSEETPPQEKPLLIVYNCHCEDSGEPPSYEVNAKTNTYISYFENKHGEQWVFSYDLDAETGSVCGGDAGWENVYSVVDGRAPGLILSQEEQVWLAACWYAATAHKETREKIRAGDPEMMKILKELEERRR